jgi:hypothetical protein
VVQNLDDSGPGSLRAAIEQANQDPAPDAIQFAQGLAGTISLTSGLPDLSTDLSISGPGSSDLELTRSTSSTGFRILSVSEGVNVSITGLTISHGIADPLMSHGGGILNAGTLTLVDVSVHDSYAFDCGGGIDNEGTLTLVATSVTNNTAGLNVQRARGGGIFNHGQLTIVDSTIRDNQAGSEFAEQLGGGVENDGTLTIVNSTVADNLALARGGGFGGGINNTGTMAAIGTTLTGNVSGGRGQAYGGAIANSGTLTIANCTISGNFVGVAIPNTSLVAGSGIDNSGKLDVIDCTLSGNIILGTSGGDSIANHSTQEGAVRCVGSILNSPGSQTVSGSAGAAFQSLGHNLFSDAPGIALDESDLINTDPQLGPLAANGGPTMTMALLPGSPAVDAGIAVPGITTDQRGVIRPQGHAPDIGAFESPYSAPLPVVENPQRLGVHMHPTRLVVRFSQPMDATSAAAMSNYVLVTAGADHRLGTKDDRVIPFRSVQYDSAAQTVTLQPIRRLPLRLNFLLTIKGEPPAGLKGARGLFLDGGGTGQPGTNFVARITDKLLVPPVRHPAAKPAVIVRHARPR